MNHWSSLRAWFSKVSDWLDDSPLRYWTFHVCVSAAPSFAFGFAMEPNLQRFLGMALGVMFFIVLYTWAARWTCPREGATPLWKRAIRLGTWIKTTSALLIWVGLPLEFALGNTPVLFVFAPDFFAGMAAHVTAAKLTGVEFGSAAGLGRGGDVGFTFLVTVIDGFLLSGLLFLIAFICLGVLKLVARRGAPLQVTPQP